MYVSGASLRGALKLLYRGLNDAAIGMAEYDDEPSLETLSYEFDAADLGRRDDISGYADDEQIAQPLIKNDLDGNPGVRTAEDGSERFLSCRELGSTPGAGQRYRASDIIDKAPISLTQAL